MLGVNPRNVSVGRTRLMVRLLQRTAVRAEVRQTERMLHGLTNRYHLQRSQRSIVIQPPRLTRTANQPHFGQTGTLASTLATVARLPHDRQLRRRRVQLGAAARANLRQPTAQIAARRAHRQVIGGTKVALMLTVRRAVTAHRYFQR